jgi:TonB-linked SusC/RagA family outer membrane protein
MKKTPDLTKSPGSKQILRIMKVTVLILFLGVTTVLATPGVAQQVKVNLKLDDVTLRDVFREIEKQSDYDFFYNDQYIDLNSKVSVDKESTAVSEVLTDLLKGTELTYKLIEGNLIVITPVSQQKVVTGVVLDETGSPLPSVIIKVRGTNKATASDIDGRFKIDANPGDTLMFTFVGYTPKEMVATGYPLSIQLIPEVKLLDEVVVTGYQTLSKERATGAISKVTSTEWADKRLSSLSSVMEGKMAGYNDGLIRGVTTMNGTATPLYVIDGFPVENTRFNQYGSLEESLPDLNMEDVESITVLKDAAAASIYGARAANGVVVIVTKKAAKGETTVSLSSTLTLTPVNNYTGNLANSAALIDLENEWAETNPNLMAGGASAAAYAQSYLDNAVYNSQGIKSWLNYYAGNMSESDLQTKLKELSSRGYRYYNDVFKYGKRNKLEQQYNVSIAKGSDKNSLHASLTYKNNKLEDKYSCDESFGININNTTYIRDWFQLDLGSYTNYSDGTTQTYDLLSPGYSYAAYDGLADDNGNPLTNTAADRYSIYDQSVLSTYGLYSMDITPLDELGKNLGKTKDFSNRTYARITLKFSDWLKYSAAFENEYGNYNYNQLSDKDSYSVHSTVNSFASYDYDANKTVFNLPYGNIYTTRTNETGAYNFRQQLDFNKVYREKHELTAIAGFEVRQNKVDYNSHSLYNYDPEMLSYTSFDNSLLVDKYFYGVWEYGYLSKTDVDYQRELVNRYVSIYGNAAYTYDKRLTMTGSLRWDRSNLWGTNSKYQNKPTWSVGGVWNIDRENFFSQSVVSMLKVRASYGIGGNIAKNSAPYMTAYYYNNTNVGGTYGVISGRPNPKLSWEQTITSNLGVDFALLNNKLNGSIDMYNKLGKDLLANTMGVPTEGFGYSTYTINNGRMTNKGFEINLSGALVKHNDFSFTLSGLFNYNKNKVTYVNVEAPVYYLQLDYPSAYPRKGNPFNSIYGYRWAGLSATGLPQVYDASGNAVSYQPTNLDDIKYFGTTVPVYSGSVNPILQYKGWTFSMLFLFEGGHKIRNTFIPSLSSSYSSALYSDITPISGKISSNITKRWKQAGDEMHTNVPRAVFAESPDYSYDLYTIYSMADVNILDAANIRLRNISLNYSIASEFCRKMMVKSARLQFNIENLFMIAKSPEAKYMLGGYEKPGYVWGLYLNF